MEVEAIVIGNWLQRKKENGAEKKTKRKVKAFEFLDSIKNLKSLMTKAELLRCNTGYREGECFEFVREYYKNDERIRRRLVSKTCKKTPDAVLALEPAEKLKQKEDEDISKDEQGAT